MVFNVSFTLGDFRTNENTALAAHQHIWVREHNRICDSLNSSHPSWSEEKRFQEARRINIAQYQHILYNEFLPPLVGYDIMEKMDILPSRAGYKRQYNPNIDPTIQVNTKVDKY